MPQHVEQACDRCRRRKAKCDGQSPTCGRCLAADAACEFNLPVGKRGPKFRRRAARATPAAATSEVSSNRVENVNPVENVGRVEDVNPALPSGEPSLQNLEPSPVVWQPPEQDLHLSPRIQDHARIERPIPIAPDAHILASRHLQGPAQEAHAALLAEATSLGLSLPTIAEESLNLAVQRIFPLAPCFDPSAIWRRINMLLLPSDALFTGTPENQLDNVRTYALITAMCSYTCARASPNHPDSRLALASHFLAASRQALAAYEDSDIQLPDSRSLAIRTQQASSLHYLGRGRLSRYILGQAFRLAVDMRLSDEASYAALEPQEAQLQRNMFWFLYTSDKSASALSGTSSMLHDGPPRRLEGPGGVEAAEWTVTFLAEFDPVLYTEEFERQLGEGIALARRVWALGSDISRIMLLLSQSLELTMTPNTALADSAVFQKIADMYLTFCSLPDHLPLWLHEPGAYTDGDTAESVLSTRRMMLWMQKADVLVTHYCLRLILTQQAFRQGYPTSLGMTADPAMLDLRATDLAEGLVLAIKELPHEALVVNGEALVEKLRRFGVALLEIGERSHSKALRVRARRLLATLLDTIASLDSKASDDLIPEGSV